MRILKSLYSAGTGVCILLAAALLLVAPYGCSKEGGKAPAQKAEETTAQPAPNPAKEHFDKGVEFSLKGDIDNAIKEYEAALLIDPSIAEAHNNLGFAYMDKGDLAKALENQKKAVELKPALANGYYGLAMVYERQGKKKEAIANWKKFASLSQPHSKWWMQAQEHIRVLEGRKKLPPAKKTAPAPAPAPAPAK